MKFFTPQKSSEKEYRQSNRLDNFVDGAFAFAITLLVISGANMPKSIDAFLEALKGVPAFAASFAQLAFFWHGHVRWRETVKLTDKKELAFSLLLVFFALIFVFPLHLVYSGLFYFLSNGFLSGNDFYLSSGQNVLNDLKTLFICYGLSYACMGGTLSILFGYSKQKGGNLSKPQSILLYKNKINWLFAAGIGLLSTVIALIASSSIWIVIAGFCYALMSFSGVASRRAAKKEAAKWEAYDELGHEP